MQRYHYDQYDSEPASSHYEQYEYQHQYEEPALEEENETEEEEELQEKQQQQPTRKEPKIQIVRSEIKPSGEAIQVVRPLASTKESSEEIVKRLINQYGTRPAWDQSEL